MGSLSKQDIIKEIKAIHDKIKELTGQECKVSRLPFGDYSNTDYHCQRTRVLCYSVGFRYNYINFATQRNVRISNNEWVCRLKVKVGIIQKDPGL
ncbi:hypothetical protein [Thermosediminibacter oceani]|uniref:hypothetical protein n=1 Tax=Thermosediminibacter oceani TaxID=291990 RepID=UPI0009FE119F|nr:hypothetical protein [Thermosediminibacter oceani]